MIPVSITQSRELAIPFFNERGKHMTNELKMLFYYLTFYPINGIITEAIEFYNYDNSPIKVESVMTIRNANKKLEEKGYIEHCSNVGMQKLYRIPLRRWDEVKNYFLTEMKKFEEADGNVQTNLQMYECIKIVIETTPQIVFEQRKQRAEIYADTIAIENLEKEFNSTNHILNNFIYEKKEQQEVKLF